MNTVAADFMDASARLDVLADIRGLVTDTDTSANVVFYARGARTYSAGAGTATSAETSANIRASVYAARDAEGAVIPGTIRVVASGADFVEDPDIYERLVVSSISYTIIDRQTDLLGAVHTLTARKAA